MPSLPLDPVPAYPSTSSHLPSLRSLTLSLSNFPIPLSCIFAFPKDGPCAFLAHPPALLLSIIITLSFSPLCYSLFHRSFLFLVNFSRSCSSHSLGFSNHTHSFCPTVSSRRPTRTTSALPLAANLFLFSLLLLTILVSPFPWVHVGPALSFNFRSIKQQSPGLPALHCDPSHTLYPLRVAIPSALFALRVSFAGCISLTPFLTIRHPTVLRIDISLVDSHHSPSFFFFESYFFATKRQNIATASIMKVSTSSILSIALALNGVLASPLRARGYEVVTVTETETKIVDVTLTTYVDPPQYTPTEVPTPTADPNEKNKNKNHVPTSTPSTTSSTSTSTTISTPPTLPTTSLPTTTSIPTTTSELPTSTPSLLPTSTSISVPTYSQAPPTTLEKSTVPVPITSIPTPPEPSTTAPAPTPTAGSKTPSVGGGTTYTGEATFYNTGLGACGITSQDTDCIAAIGSPLFDAQGAPNPNNNPLCGKVILVSYKGGPEISVTIRDRCPECKYGDLDLSPAAFTQMGANQNDGRVPVTWRFA